MAIELEMPESTDTGGSYLDKAGTFLCLVMETSESPTKDDGSLIPNAAFSAHLEVAAGAQKGKSKNVVFFNPAPDKKGSKGYEMELKKQRRFLEAAGVVAERVPSGTGYTVEVSKAVSRLVKITFAFDTREGKERNLQLHFADIWHIDDPDAAQCEVDPKVLSLVPASLRRKPESFQKEKSKSPPAAPNGNGNGSPGHIPARETAPASNVDPSDL